MSAEPERPRYYPFTDGRSAKPPDFSRAVRSLSSAEILEELAAARGGPDYQAALRAELAERRGRSI